MHGIVCGCFLYSFLAKEDIQDQDSCVDDIAQLSARSENLQISATRRLQARIRESEYSEQKTYQVIDEW